MERFLTWIARLLTLPVPVPARVRASRRSRGRIVAIAFALLSMAMGTAGAGTVSARPENVPDLTDPNVQQKYLPIQVGTMGGNKDLPLVMLVNQGSEKSEAILIGLDARNGKSTWSLLSDPIILVALFADPATITELDVDLSFLSEGTPSGSLQRVPDPRPETLPELLRAIASVPERTFL
jgi:hypothetical protein